MSLQEKVKDELVYSSTAQEVDIAQLYHMAVSA
jgi:hypothetical protein